MNFPPSFSVFPILINIYALAQVQDLGTIFQYFPSLYFLAQSFSKFFWSYLILFTVIFSAPFLKITHPSGLPVLTMVVKLNPLSHSTKRHWLILHIASRNFLWKTKNDFLKYSLDFLNPRSLSLSDSIFCSSLLVHHSKLLPYFSQPLKSTRLLAM